MMLSHPAEHLPIRLQHWDAIAVLCAMLTSALLVALFTIGALIHGACAMGCMWMFLADVVPVHEEMQEDKELEVVQIDDSPPPTMKTCSPFRPTPSPRLRRCVNRGGRRGPMLGGVPLSSTTRRCRITVAMRVSSRSMEGA